MWGIFMIKKINIFLVLLLLLVSIGAVSAADDGNAVSCNDTMTDILTSDADEGLADDVGDDELLTASNTYVVNSSNYATYFPSGKLSPTVNEGDTLQIDGSFSDKDFIINKTVNVVGTSTNSMKNCIFTFYEGGSGSTVSNLKIVNTKDYAYGVFLNGASNCVIHDCFINNTGQSSYTICVANNANYNNVSNNVLSAYGKTYGHSTRSTPPLLLCNAHYNEIGNNDISCDDANGIYLSSYEGGPLKGGESTFNYIHDNTVKYNVLPTSWAYGIQIMGKNNTISSNRVIGAYRGISTSNAGNVIVDNWIINLTGADYNNPGEETGGEIAIVGSYNSTIKNNHIVNAKVIATGAGISALDNSVVENNIVEVTLQGKGVWPRGSNITIKNNDITTSSGSGILYDSYSFNLEVIGNNITSNTGVGVLIQKVSNKRMPGNITIVENTIETNNKYAIDALEADANSTNVIDRNNVIGKSLVRTPEGSYDPSKPAYNFNGTVHNITPDNYCDYINEEGGLSPDIKTGDILNFIGEFHNKLIKINAPIKITGDNPTFYNSTFRVACDGVWIENLTIINDKASRVNAWGVVIYKVAGATVTNCDIKVYDPKAAYAIYVVEASDIDIINNTLYSSGDYLTYTLLIYSVEDGKFINNTIDTLGTGEVHQWEQEHCLDGDTNCLDGDTFCLDGDTFCLDGDTNCLDGDTFCLDGDSIAEGNHMLSEVYRTYGILMAYSSDNVVSGNKVHATSKLNRTVSPYNSTNSIVGIDAYFNCQNNVFYDNEVYVKAYDNYLYGMGVLGFTTGHTAPEGQGAINDQFINNYINVEGTYCVTGIIIGDETTDTIIEDNIIDLKTDKVAYGITLEMSQKSTIKDNYLTVNSDVIYGVEALASSDNNIVNNEFVLNAKQAYGLVFSNGKSNSVVNNVILANGTGEKLDFKVLDSLPAGNAGIFLKSNSSYNEINKNNIQSRTNYAILVDDEAIGNVITENCLDSEKGIGNAAVNNTKNNIVENNYRYTFTGKMSSMRANYLDTVKLTLTVNDGAFVKFYIGDKEVGSANSSNGAAVLEYQLDESLTPGNYKVKAVASKENYLTKEFSATLRINKGNLNVELDDVSAKLLSKANFTAIVTDASGRPVSGVEVSFYRNQGRDVYIGKATTGTDGVAKLEAEIPSISGNSFPISANVAADSKFNAASGQATLFILKDKSIQIELNDIEVVYNDGKNLVAVVKDDDGKTVSGLNVNVQLNGANSTITSDKDGKVTIPLAGLLPDTYTANVVFPGNDVYTGASASAEVTVNKIETKLTAAGAVVTLKDANGNPISDAKLNVQLNGVNSTLTTDKDGKATIQTSGLSPDTYTANVAFAGDNIYKASRTTTEIIISKLNTSLTASDVVTDYNGGKSLVAVLKDENGNAVKDAQIKIVLGNVTETLTTDANGQVSLTTDGLVPNNYTATITFDGKDIYKASNTTAKVTVNKLETKLTAEYDANSKYIVATVKDANGNPVSGLKVGFAVDGVKYVTTDANGKANYSTSGLVDKTYNVKVQAYGNEIYKDSNQETVTVSSTKVSTTLTASDVVTDYNGGKSLVAVLKDENGNAVKDAQIKIVLGNVTETLTTDANGQVSLTTDGLVPNNYTATITFDGKDIYKASNTTAKVTVNKLETKLTAEYDANSKYIVATVKDANGNPVKGLKVGFAIDGVKYNVTDENGQAVYSTKDLVDKVYTASVMAYGNEIYNDSNKVTVKFGEKKQSKIFLRNALYFVTQTKMVQVTLWDGNNQPLANKTVSIRAYDSVWHGVTDENGDAFVRVGIGFGVHDATVSFDGDNQYNASTRAGYIRVIKQTPSVMVRGADTMFKASDNNKIVKVHLRDRYDKALPAGSKIVIKLNGKTYVGTTDINGVASIKISINTVGTFTAQAMYGGNTAYNAVTRDVKIRIV